MTCSALAPKGKVQVYVFMYFSKHKIRKVIFLYINKTDKNKFYMLQNVHDIHSKEKIDLILRQLKLILLNLDLLNPGFKVFVLYPELLSITKEQISGMNTICSH